MDGRKKAPPSDIPPETPYRWFDLIYPTNKRGRRDIEDLLLIKGSLNLAPYAVLDYILTPQTGRSTPVCKTIVLEDRYRDRDHSKALASYYAKSFRQIEHECKRLHFFARRLRPDFLVTKNTQELQRAYLGFCVLRPFAQRIIGRTVLRRLTHRAAQESSACQGVFEVHLAGHKLKLQGAAFIEQDTMVAACASASIWMSTTITGTRFGLQQRTTSEITNLATQYLIGNRPMPSEGLVVEQMLHCLRAMEYDPLLVGVHSQNQAKHDMYTYVESGIPPILLCNFPCANEGHAIVAVGYGYNVPNTNPYRTEVDWPGEPPLKFARSSEWVTSILINDDQRGPHRRLSFIDSQALEARIRAMHPGLNVDHRDLEGFRCPAAIDVDMPYSGHSDDPVVTNIWGMIIPLPPGVMLSAVQAERKSARVINWWHLRNREPLPTDMVLRTYLIQSSEYKHKNRAGVSGGSAFVTSMITGKPMPRWIWVTEISAVGSYDSVDLKHRLINGQVIIDATSNAFTPDFLLFHYIVAHRAVLITMRPEHKDAEQALSHYWVSKTDSKRYTGWIR